MLTGLKQLEQTVEREMSLLTHLPPATPGANVLQRVQRAVLAEAARRPARPDWWRWRAPLGAAAGLLLVFGWLSLPAPQVNGGAEAALGEWAVAFEASSDGLASVLSVAAEGSEDERDLNEMFDSLGESLEELQSL
jgi:hypothetical protein